MKKKLQHTTVSVKLRKSEIRNVNTHSKVGRSLIQKWATRERMQS